MSDKVVVMCGTDGWSQRHAQSCLRRFYQQVGYCILMGFRTTFVAEEYQIKTKLLWVFIQNPWSTLVHSRKRQKLIHHKLIEYCPFGQQREGLTVVDWFK